jgi:hypothetical protein
MASSFQLPPNSTGTQIETRAPATPLNREVVVIGDGANNNIATVNGNGQMSVVVANGSNSALVSILNELRTQIGGSNTSAIAVGNNNNTIIKASAGRLVSVLVTSNNNAVMQFTDGANGTVIGQIPANQNGNLFTFNMPAANSIVAVGNNGNPAVTVSYY